MEEKATHIFERVTNPIDKALEIAGLTMDQIN